MFFTLLHTHPTSLFIIETTDIERKGSEFLLNLTEYGARTLEFEEVRRFRFGIDGRAGCRSPSVAGARRHKNIQRIYFLQ